MAITTAPAPSPGVDLAGKIIGGIIGGGLGSILGPIGTAAGRAIGSQVGRAAARAAAAAISQMMEDANEDAEEQTEEQDATQTCADCGEIDCFSPPDGADPEEFARQLQEQEDAINNMSPDELLNNMRNFRANGRGSGDAAARRQTRGEFRTRRTRELTEEYLANNPTMSIGEAQAAAAAQAGRELAELAATHVLDMIAGGDGSISGLGNSRINSSIGSQWRHGRAEQLRQNAQKAKEQGAEKMDVSLEVCPEEGADGQGGSTPTESGPGSPGTGSGTADVPMS